MTGQVPILVRKRCSRHLYRSLLIPSSDEHVDASWVGGCDLVVHDMHAFAAADVDAFHTAALASVALTLGANEQRGLPANETDPYLHLRTKEKTKEYRNSSFHPCGLPAYSSQDSARREMDSFPSALDAVVVAFYLGNAFDRAEFVASVETAAVSWSVVVSLQIDCPYCRPYDTAIAVKKQLPWVIFPSTHLLQDLGRLTKSFVHDSSL